MSSMGDSGGNHSIPRHFRDSFYTFTPQQPPYFSPPTEQEGDHYRGLESLFVDRPPGLLTSPPGDQNYSINPVIAPPVVPFHTTTLYTNGSGGNYVDQIEYPAPHCALSHRAPAQVPPSNDYTQAYSTTSSLLSYDPPELHNTQAYHDPSRHYYTQVVQGQSSNHIDMDTMQPHRVAPMIAHAHVGVMDTISPIQKARARFHPCPILDCPRSFHRPQDQKRHVLTHLPHWIHCSVPDCSWRGDRLRAFKRHWTDVHPSSSQELGEDQYKTYDPLPLVKKIIGRALSIQDAEKDALSMVRKKASELGRKELYENPWGRKRRAQRPC